MDILNVRKIKNEVSYPYIHSNDMDNRGAAVLLRKKLSTALPILREIFISFKKNFN